MARRLASGNLKYFIEAGTLNDDGCHSVRYTTLCPHAIDTYSGPGSPYWSGKAFWSFLLPDDHAFWTDAEQPLPVEKASYEFNLPGPGILVRFVGRPASASPAEGYAGAYTAAQTRLVEEAFAGL